MGNIPKGYKQTEVGVIPSDWEVDKIKNLAHITTGSKNTQDRIDSGEYPFFVRSQTVERINSYSFDGEAVLTAGDGVGTGKVFHYIKGKFDFHQRVYKVSDFKDKLDGYYFYLYFSNNFYNRIMQMTAKSSVDSVRMEMIADMQIPLPHTKAEQTAIAIVLSDADALISSLEKLIAKKRNIKQGAMQELLTGKKRLPGFGGKLVSMGNGKLRDLFEISPPRKQIGWDEVVTFIGMEDVSEDGTIISHNLLPYSEIKNGLTYFEKKDVLVAKITPCFENGKGACLDNLKTEKGFGSTEFHILRANNNSVPRYVFYHTQSAKFRRKLEAEMVGSAGQKRVSSSAILNYPLSIVHSKAEQTAVAQILSDMDAEIEALEQKLVKYRMIKQGMMQELLTGKTRLV